MDDVISTFEKVKYETINNYVNKNKIDNVFDIYSYYNPRIIELKNVKYININDKSRHYGLINILENIKLDSDNAIFLVENIFGDNFNYELESITGNSVIIIDELLNYLDESNYEIVLNNLIKVMKKYNAKIITFDVETKNIITEIGNALYNDGNNIYNEYVEVYKYSYKGIINDNLNYDSIFNNLDLKINKIKIDKNFVPIEKFTDVRNSNLSLIFSRNYYYEISL